MKNQIVVTALTAIMAFQISAKADEGLKGTWRLAKQECSSGAPYVLFGDQSSNTEGSFDVTVVITEDQLRTRFGMKMKYEKSYGDSLIKQLQDAIELTQKQPDGPEKQKSLADLNNSLQFVEQYAAGVNCVTSEVSSYSLNGSILHTGAVTSYSSNCPGSEGSDGDKTESDSIIELNGNTLKVTEVNAEANDSSCPKGDKTIATFVRVK